MCTNSLNQLKTNKDMCENMNKRVIVKFYDDKLKDMTCFCDDKVSLNFDNGRVYFKVGDVMLLNNKVEAKMDFVSIKTKDVLRIVI